LKGWNNSRIILREAKGRKQGKYPLGTKEWNESPHYMHLNIC